MQHFTIFYTTHLFPTIFARMSEVLMSQLCNNQLKGVVRQNVQQAYEASVCVLYGIQMPSLSLSL